MAAEEIDLGPIYEGDDPTGESKPGAVFDMDGDDGHPAERKPSRTEPRTSTEELFTTVWRLAGTGLILSGYDVPVGRVLAMQAPLAGKKVDELIVGTFLDPFIQPLAKSGDKAQGLGALILTPLLVGLYERNPAAAPLLEPLLRQALTIQLADLAPVLKEQLRKERASARAVTELVSDLELDPQEASTDPIGAFISMLFSGAVEAEPEGDGE